MAKPSTKYITYICNVAEGFGMETLKSQIYWACDQLRKYEAFGLENSKTYKDLLAEVHEMQAKYEKAKKFFDDFMQECRDTPYFK